MHKLLRKGVALVMGAAVILGSLGFGATTVEAAGTYETEYKLEDLVLLRKSDGITLDGENISWTDQYQTAFYEIPVEIRRAGFLGYKCTGTVTDGKVHLKIVDPDDLWHEITGVGPLTSFDSESAVAKLESNDDQPKAKLIGLMSETAEGESAAAKVTGVTFLTQKKPEPMKSVQGTDGYETTYQQDELSLYLKQDGITISGNDITWTAQYAHMFYSLPEQIKEAGFLGVKFTGEVKTGGIYVIMTEPDGRGWVKSGEKSYNSANGFDGVVMMASDDKTVSDFDLVGLMSLDASVEATVTTITFITKDKAFEGPVEDNTNTDTDTTENGSPNAGESPTAIAAADKKAWDDAKAEIDAGTKKEVTVTLKTDTTVPKAVLESLAGKDVTLKIDLGKNIVWTIKGTDVKAADAKDVNLKVTLDAGSIPADTMKAAAKGNDYKKIQLAYDGQFGFKAVLTIKIDTKYKGKYAQLFYYNTTDKKMEYISSGKVADDGKVDLTFTHASDYIIVLADQETPKTADVNWGVWVVMLVLAGNMLLLAGYGVLLKNKRSIFG